MFQISIGGFLSHKKIIKNPYVLYILPRIPCLSTGTEMGEHGHSMLHSRVPVTFPHTLRSRSRPQALRSRSKPPLKPFWITFTGNGAAQEAKTSFSLVFLTSFWPAPNASQVKAEIQYNSSSYNSANMNRKPAGWMEILALFAYTIKLWINFISPGQKIWRTL